MTAHTTPLYPGSGDNLVHNPVILRLNIFSDKQVFNSLIAEGNVSFIHDEIYSQLQELIKGQNPSIRIKGNEYESLILKHLNGQEIDQYGVWVYYPWSKRLVHLLDE